MWIERNLPDSGKLSRGAAICPTPVLTLSSKLFEPMDFQLSNSSMDFDNWCEIISLMRHFVVKGVRPHRGRSRGDALAGVPDETIVYQHLDIGSRNGKQNWNLEKCDRRCLPHTAHWTQEWVLGPEHLKSRLRIFPPGLRGSSSFQQARSPRPLCSSCTNCKEDWGRGWWLRY